MTTGPPIDMPTAQALVRLRLLTEDAMLRVDDLSEVGRHRALIALDGAVEYALWLATQHAGIVLKNGDRASVQDLHSAVRAQGWNLKGWPGVNQLHRARNEAQHAGVPPDREPLPAWRDSATAFIDSLCIAAFAIRLDEIAVTTAIRDPQIRALLIEADELISADPARAFRTVLAAFAIVRNKWRDQRNTALPALAKTETTAARWATNLSPGDPAEALQDLLEVQPFASSLGEYVWLRRVKVEQGDAGRPPTEDEGRRAIAFVADWVVRWEIFDQGYPNDQWEAYREGIEPPATDDRAPGKIVGAEVEFVREIAGRPAANRLFFTIANVPGRGRDPWPAFLDRAISECVASAQAAASASAGEVEAGRALMPRWSYWYRSGVLGFEFEVSIRADDVIGIVEQGIALAVGRYEDFLVQSERRERERTQLETELRRIVHDASQPQQQIFGDVRVAADEWAGSGGWMAFIEVLAASGGGDPTESYHAHQAFTSQRPNLENLNQRDGNVTFTLAELTEEIEEALRASVAAAEAMIRRVRVVRAEQVTAHKRFATALNARYGHYAPP